MQSTKLKQMPPTRALAQVRFDFLQQLKQVVPPFCAFSNMPLPVQTRDSLKSQTRLVRPWFGILLVATLAADTSFSSAIKAAQDIASPDSSAAVIPASSDAKSPSSVTAQFQASQRTGAIQLLPGPSPMHEGKILPLLYNGGIGPSDQSITAGELWSFFQRQGLHKVESIVLFLDVNKFDDPESITIKNIEFRIEPTNTTLPVTNCALSESNPLIIPGYDSLSNLPEARLEIPLEFDFMQRYSADSRDRVFLKIAYEAPAGNAPSFFVAGQQDWITLPSFTLIAGFVAFWGGLFYLLARLTLKSIPAAANERRVS